MQREEAGKKEKKKKKTPAWKMQAGSCSEKIEHRGKRWQKSVSQSVQGRENSGKTVKQLAAREDDDLHVDHHSWFFILRSATTVD